MVDRIQNNLINFSDAGPLKVDIIVGTSDQVSQGIATHTVDSFATAVSNNDSILFLDGTHIPAGVISLTETGVKIRMQSKDASITTSTHTFTSTGGDCDIELNVSTVGNVTVSGTGTTSRVNNVLDSNLIIGRRDTAANFISSNPILSAGEFAYEIDTGYLKIGDGSTAWVTLPYKNVKKTIWDADSLLYNVDSTTTAVATAKNISMLNSSGIPAFKEDMSETFNTGTDIMTGMSLVANRWYQSWVSIPYSGGPVTRLLVEDIEGTTDGTTAGYLDDSTLTAATKGVKAGDVVYNTANYTSTTVATTPTVDGDPVELTDDIFLTGETYKISLRSPTGLEEYKARFGLVETDGSSNLDNSGYTRPELQDFPQYVGDDSGDLEFTLSATGATISSVERAVICVYQKLDFSNTPVWRKKGEYSYTLTGVDASYNIVTTGVTYKNATGHTQSVTAIFPVVTTFFAYTKPNDNYIQIGLTTANSSGFLSFDVELDKKPTFATRS